MPIIDEVLVHNVNPLCYCMFKACGKDVAGSNTRICTGHISKAPTEYTFLVEKGYIDIVDRKVNLVGNRSCHKTYNF